MAQTFLGPSEIVPDMGSSSHLGLIVVLDQGANSDSLGFFFWFFFSIFYTIIACCIYSLELSQWGDSNKHTQYTILW